MTLMIYTNVHYTHAVLLMSLGRAWALKCTLMALQCWKKPSVKADLANYKDMLGVSR